MKQIYLDNAATMRIYDSVLEEMLPFLKENYGNASAMYSLASLSRRAIDRARDRAARLVGAKASEIYFTSGGSEADNWALTAVFEAFSEKGCHIIVSKIEHHAVLRTCEYLEKRGARITYIDPDASGRVSPEAIEAAICPDTILVSVMTANNEVGTIQPIKEISQAAHRHGILFHTDAVQAYGHIPINTEEMGIDLMSASAHKIGGPKGVGLLYIRSGIRVGSLIRGGAQERNRRAGTENTAGIVGFGKAAEEAFLHMKERAERTGRLRNRLISLLEEKVPEAVLTGSRDERLPNNVNILLPGMEGESVLIALDLRGIAASSGAACSSGSLDPSHVLLAMGVPYELALSSVRFSLSEENTEDELAYTAEALAGIVRQIADEKGGH